VHEIGSRQVGRHERVGGEGEHHRGAVLQRREQLGAAVRVREDAVGGGEQDGEERVGHDGTLSTLADAEPARTGSRRQERIGA
jgi:hypothetical protein